MGVTVYKLGGSLLSLPDLVVRLAALLARDGSAAHPLLTVGGGPTADLVREWDRAHGLGEERAHWLALESVRLNEALVTALLPGSRIIASRGDAERAWSDGSLPILCVHEFLRENESSCGLPLPHTWDVTSDSIAAWVAAVWPADRLVLLKSVSLASSRTERERLVDPHFERLAPQIPEIGWINLRGDSLAVESWPRDADIMERIADGPAANELHR